MAVVHREVAALPEADRAAFILNVLEGLTQAETAARLGRTSRVVAGQVARAKKRLVMQLTRRGVVPGLMAIGTASVASAVPPRLPHGTHECACCPHVITFNQTQSRFRQNTIDNPATFHMLRRLAAVAQEFGVIFSTPKHMLLLC
jgi:hypothetical protein